MVLIEVFYWLSILALVHSYLFYPLYRYLRSTKFPAENLPSFIEKDALRISVIMSAFNEEVFILDKMDNLFELDYPTDKIDFYIGSDGSFDRTNELAAQYPALENDNWHFFPFSERRGKPAVINELIDKALNNGGGDPNHLLLITDVSVFMEPDVPKKLMRHFFNPEIGLVDSFIMNTNDRADGIGMQEKSYISLEAKIKHWESLDGGLMIGPFGGCYMLRSDYFTKVPDNYLVDDFFIAMEVFRKGGLAINDLSAVCTESNSSDILEEFKRKSRISAGNFQNLVTFKDLLWPPFSKLAFNFISHKVLRWLGPLFIVTFTLLGLILGLSGNLFYFTLFLISTLTIIAIPLFDFYLEGLGVHNRYLRFLRYFVVMNIAIVKGFIRFLKGIKSGAWDPPKRK